jgi:hypothetical protein
VSLAKGLQIDLLRDTTEHLLAKEVPDDAQQAGSAHAFGRDNVPSRRPGRLRLSDRHCRQRRAVRLAIESLLACGTVCAVGLLPEGT